MSTTPATDCDLRMRAKVDACDWSQTPLGPRDDWPAALEAAVQLVLDSHFPKLVFWGEHLSMIYNDAYRVIMGDKPDALGQSVKEVWPEVWDDIKPMVDAAFSGQSTFVEDYPLTVERGRGPEQAWFTWCYTPLRLADGSVAGILDTVVETTRTVEARQDLELANHELAHRLKNSLAIVRAIASQTLRKTTEPGAFESFESRLVALDHAHTVLLQQDWSTGSLRKAVLDSLVPNADLGRITLAGEDAEIGSKTSMALSMMLHELATNAVKYGALSNDTGQVAIAWTVTDTDFTIEWRETGGPPVQKPERTGFGTRLIRRGLGGASQGHTAFDPAGVIFTLVMPVDELGR
ncbi:MAG: HWE histidine kinase domain-containing protein [Pseudomonadota bacterium]